MVFTHISSFYELSNDINDCKLKPVQKDYLSLENVHILTTHISFVFVITVVLLSCHYIDTTLLASLRKEKSTKHGIYSVHFYQTKKETLAILDKGS